MNMKEILESAKKISVVESFNCGSKKAYLKVAKFYYSNDLYYIENINKEVICMAYDIELILCAWNKYKAHLELCINTPKKGKKNE